MRRDVRDYLRFSVKRYMDVFRDCLDARGFAAMRLSGEVQTSCDASYGGEGGICTGAWKK